MSIVLLGFCRGTYAGTPAGNFKEERGEHFLIYYDTGINPAQAFAVKQEAEEYYRRITQEFHLIRDELWLWDKRAKIYIAKDKESYHVSFDCQTWSEACVDYRNKIIYTYRGHVDFTKILAHELTHIIFREYSRNNKLALWLDEGMATYIEDKYSGGHYKRSLKIIRAKISDNTHIPFSEFTGVSAEDLALKQKEYVTLFYAQSYSLVNFIITKYGRHNFSRFLSYMSKGMTLEDALAKVYFDFRDFSKLEPLWKKFY